jgi:hypothetical protein
MSRSSLGLVCGGSGTEAGIVLLLHLDVYRASVPAMYHPVQYKVCRTFWGFIRPVSILRCCGVWKDLLGVQLMASLYFPPKMIL